MRALVVYVCASCRQAHARIVFIAGKFSYISLVDMLCVMASIQSMRLISHNKIPENYGPPLRPCVCVCVWVALHSTIYVMTMLSALLMCTAVLSAKPQVSPRPGLKRRARTQTRTHKHTLTRKHTHTKTLSSIAIDKTHLPSRCRERAPASRPTDLCGPVKNYYIRDVGIFVTGAPN